MTLRRVGVVLAAVTVAVAVAALGLARGWWRYNHPNDYPVWGVDVSHHQGDIDWTRVAAHPRIKFAYIKASEGGDLTDSRFADNWREARRAGLRTGAYHFFTFCRPAVDQARNFIWMVPKEPDALPPVVDVEFGGNCAGPHDKVVLKSQLELWLKLVEQAYGKKPIVYLTQDAYDSFAPLDGPLWMRSLFGKPREPWALWQFANRDRVPGIVGPVDLNVSVTALR